MKGSNSLLFLIFISIFLGGVYYFYNNGNFMFYLGKTKVVNTKIDSIKLISGLKGRGFNQKIFFQFDINQNTYKSYFINNKTRWNIIDLEDSLQIKFTESNPKNFKVIGVYYNSKK